MAKNLLLDTNVLINNPLVLYDFKDKNVEAIILSETTIQELDTLKNEQGEKGKKAREVIKELVKISDNKGIINETQILMVVPTFSDNDLKSLNFFRSITNDERIIATLYKCSEKFDDETIFLTFDNIAYIKAKLFIKHNNIKASAELFDVEKTDKKLTKEYSGRIDIYTSNEVLNKFSSEGKIDFSELFTYDENELQLKPFVVEEIVENEFVCLYNFEKTSSMLGRIKKNNIVKLDFAREHPFGVTAKNLGQTFFQEALMQGVDSAPLVICKGPAGTAKTFYSIAVGLEKVMNAKREDKEYKKILCCRPNVQMDEDLGFLPGDEQEKIQPYFRPIIDNLEALISDKNSVADLVAFGNINFEAVAFMRGRSIVNTYLIVDEAQNLTITQVKGIITRAGQGTKIVLIGDPDQIDNPYLDRHNNGLSYASDKMKGSPYCWQITMTDTEGVRSKIATEAAQRL